MSGEDWIGKYRLVTVTAPHPNGRVLVGFDSDRQRQVSIRVGLTFAAPKDARSFLERTERLAELHHPHILPIYDAGQTDEGRQFIVSKFIPGITLEEKIQNDRPNYGQSASLVATIAETLHYMHQQDFIHGNVKPGNILLERGTGKLHVTGFGLVTPQPIQLNGAGPFSAAYVSPEWASGKPVDRRTDIFSTGIVMCELLTGQRPFQGSTALEVICARFGRAKPPREFDADVPIELDRICLKALERRPSDRYSTAEELFDDLLNWRVASNNSGNDG